MANEGEFPKADGDILYASEVNKFNASLWNDIIYVNSNYFTGILAHSATAWTAVNSTSTLITSDAGVTWTDATVDIGDMSGVSRVCTASKANAISCDFNSANISYTTDSGDNWSSATTDPLNITRVFDLSFPTATVAVVACDIGTATRGIFRSTDGGDNWAVCSTGPAVDVTCIDMVDGSNGLAIDVNGNIWTTSDGGDNWTDSGQNLLVTTNGTATMIALTSTTGICYNGATTIETFNTTSGGTFRLSLPNVDEADVMMTNMVKTTDGSVYFAVMHDNGDVGGLCTLYRSTDSGVTWGKNELGRNSYENSATYKANVAKSQLVEYDTDKLLLISGNYELTKIDVS